MQRPYTKGLLMALDRLKFTGAIKENAKATTYT